jgi:hypothetical protein
MLFSRHIEEASHYYENFRLEWYFKYSKNIMVSSKQWYLKQSFLYANQTLPRKNTIVFFNIMILSQNFKNNLFSNSP